MRYIDLDRVLEHPNGPAFIEKAEQARRAVLAEQDARRRRSMIKAYRPIWVEFRTIFENTYGSTCWYTESHNPGTDNDVDHYRPKGRIYEASRHGGYWWVALDWRNFRYSSHRANRLKRNSAKTQTLGKGDHFPLLDESKRWRCPGERRLEKPKILDPTDPADPPLLAFDQNGQVALAPAHRSPDTLARFEASRDILHLDAEEFIADRRALFTEVFRKVLKGDRAVEEHANNEPGADARLRDISRELIQIAQDGQPYARAATSHICRFRDRGWIEQMVVPHLKMTHEP